MEEAKHLLWLMAALAIVAVAFWAFLKFVSTLDDNMQRRYGIRLKRGKGSGKNVEIQTLFHGNTKDHDQI